MDGQTCQLVPVTENGMDFLDSRCVPAGMGNVGDDCASSADCMAGLRCELIGFGGQCQSAGTKDRGDSCSSTGDCLAGLACAPDGTCEAYTDAFPQFAGVACQPETGPFRAIFEVPTASHPLADFFRQPFPSDVRVTSGKLDLSDLPRPGPTPLGIDLVQMYVDALVAEFDGFSTIAPITFRFSGPVDEASLTSAATLIDLADGSRLLALATSHPDRTKYSCPDRVVVEHAVGDVLLPKHTYAVLLRGVTSGGQAAVADGDLTTVLGAARPADPALGAAWDDFAPLRDWIAHKDTSGAPIQGATVFTVGDPVGTMGKIKSAILAAPAPVLSDLTLCDTGVASPCADGGPDRVCGAADPSFYELQGRVTIPIFQAGTAPYLTPADGGGIDGASPAVQRTEAVCFDLTIPKNVTLPAGGWPLLVYAHGTGGSFRSFINEQLAFILSSGNQPMAVLSYDGVEHGARRNGSTQSPNNLVFNITNPHAARDNVLQSGADLLQLFRTAGVTVPATGGAPAATFDASHVVFFGHSQGSNAGHLGLAYADAVAVTILSGSGGGVVDGVLSKTNPVNVADGMKYLLGKPLDITHPAMIIFQNYFDRSDPQNYAPMLIRRPPMGIPSKSVFHSYGQGDTYAPPKTLANITKALGVPLASPVLESIDDPASPMVMTQARPIIMNITGGDNADRTAATFQYAPAGYDGHFVALENPDAVTDWTNFLSNYLSTGVAYVP
jgi:hypothetical protein